MNACEPERPQVIEAYFICLEVFKPVLKTIFVIPGDHATAPARIYSAAFWAALAARMNSPLSFFNAL